MQLLSDQEIENEVFVFKCEKCRAFLWEGCKRCYQCGIKYVEAKEEY